MDTKGKNISKRKENKIRDNTGKTVIIKEEKCPQDHACPAVKACPVNALFQKGYSAPTIDYDKCIKCGRCVDVCPMGAIVFDS